MKKILLVLSLFVSTAYAAETQPSSEVEVIEGPSNRPYTMLSPISADKDSVDKAFIKLKDKASKLGADAIIGLECRAGEKVRTGFLQIKTIGSSSVCQGVAVKWKPVESFPSPTPSKSRKQHSRSRQGPPPI